MKILHVITRLDPGGSSSICLKICEELKKTGHEVILASGRTENKHTDVVILNNLRREINLILDLLAVLELIKLLKKVKPDILHLHTSKAGMLGRIASCFVKVEKIIYQPHGIVFYGYFSQFKSSLILFLERIVAPLADKIIVLTETAKNEFIQYKVGKARQYKVLENGVDLDDFRDISPEEKTSLKLKYGIKSTEFVFAMVGRLVDIKGHEYFLEAFAKLSLDMKNIKALIVGSGPEEKSLKKKAADLGIQDKVIFPGYLADPRKIYQIVDVLLQPSIVEGFGLAIVEAAASGVPAIGFEVGGIIDIIIHNETGLLAEYKNIASLTEAMRKLAENEDLRYKMGQAALERVKNKFTISIMLKKLLNIYEVKL